MGIKTKIVDAQVADLTSLRIERGKRVEDFVPGGGALTPENFDAAFRACYAWCRAQIVANGRHCYNVVLPAGSWTMSGVPLDMDGTYNVAGQPPTPGIVGPGSESCSIFVVEPLADGRGLLEVGNTNMVWTMCLKGFSIRGYGMRGNGIRVRYSYRLHIEDVSVHDFNAVQSPESGWGFAFEGANPADHQHLTLRDISSQGCQAGLKLWGVWQGTLDNVNLNQSRWMSLSVAGTLGIAMRSGNIQGASRIENPDTLWYSRTLWPECSTGWNYTTGLPGGTTASLSATTLGTDEDTGISGFGVSTLTGLTGMTVDMIGNWIRLTKSGGADYANGDIVSGLYQIVEYVSTTSVKILKGSAHGVQTGNVTWQVCGCTGGEQFEYSGFPYHEGDRRCVWFIGPSLVSSSMFKLNSVMSYNTIPLVAQGGDDGVGSIELTNAGPAATTIARLRKINKFTTDVIYKQVKFDGWSRQGAIARSYDPLTLIPRGLWDGSHSWARRLNSFIAERSSADFPGYSFDPARADTHTLSGTDIQSVKSVQDASVTLEPQYAGQCPTYVTNDAMFVGPCWNLAGGAPGVAKNLLGTIPAAKLPSVPYSPTLLVIARLPNTTVDSSGVRRMIIRPASGVADLEVAFHDGAYFPTGNYFVMYHELLNGSATVQISGTADTKAHAYALRWEMRVGTIGARDEMSTVSAPMPNVGPLGQPARLWPVGDMNLWFNRDYGSGGGSAGLLVRWVGVLTVPLCDSEIDQFLDMAASECGVPR